MKSRYASFGFLRNNYLRTTSFCETSLRRLLKADYASFPQKVLSSRFISIRHDPKIFQLHHVHEVGALGRGQLHGCDAICENKIQFTAVVEQGG